MKTREFKHGIARLLLVVLALGYASLLLAQEPALPPPSGLSATVPGDVSMQQKVFVFVQRTDRHAKYSKPEVFHDALADILNYLAAKNIAIAVDEFGGRNHAEGAIPMDTVLSIGRDAKANNVLYFAVDRPVTKWIKISVQCFDMNGKQLWQDEASNGGGLSGAHGLDATTKALHSKLDARIGQDCRAGDGIGGDTATKVVREACDENQTSNGERARGGSGVVGVVPGHAAHSEESDSPRRD